MIPFTFFSQDSDYLGIGLENGFLKLVWSFSNDNYTHEVLSEKNLHIPEPSRLLTRLVPHAGFLTDGEWHLLVVRLARENVTLTVDQTLAYVEEPGLRSEPHYEDVDVYIGKWLFLQMIYFGTCFLRKKDRVMHS